MKQSNVTVETRRRDGVCCGVFTLCFGSAFVVCLGDMLSFVWFSWLHCGVGFGFLGVRLGVSIFGFSCSWRLLLILVFGVLIVVLGVVFDGGLGWERVGDCFCWFSLKIRFTSLVVCYGGGRSVI